VSYRGSITTALQFMASFRRVRVLDVGCKGAICWTEIFADEDGTEEQLYFVMERFVRGSGKVELRHVQNPSSVELHEAKWNDPIKLWERGYTPQHGDDSAW
jgi:hypothetical protein